ncbi:MAG: DUF4199 domain-containing protein [Rikenellaceae bacterium]|jgi:hypothetical protein|nr:DUF4199 domain-containing protein [Rikenellaceae bacterium]
MTKKQFWQAASNWGFMGGAALFVMNLVAWALRLEDGNSWAYELLQFLVICPLIIVTGRRNARLAGAEGYSYGRAVGFVFAMMMFAGIVYGVGRFLLMNFIAPEYYDALNAKSFEAALAMYANLPQYDTILEQTNSMLRLLTNPVVLIFQGVFELVIKGGFLGLVLCAFFTRKPDIFAETGDENRNE